MLKRIDLTGQKFDRLKVISYAGTDKRGKALWKCECECENIVIVAASNLKRGITKSCGCLRSELSSKRILDKNLKHGDSRKRLYRIWRGMIDRTQNVNNCNYHKYGEKGVEICIEWNEYKNFKEWALKNGYKDNLTIDRKDNRKGYTTDNCRWVTSKEQNRNTTRNRIIEYRGKKKTIVEWAEIYSINYQTLSSRLNKLGWSTEKALETPVQGKNAGYKPY